MRPHEVYLQGMRREESAICGVPVNRAAAKVAETKSGSGGGMRRTQSRRDTVIVTFA